MNHENIMRKCTKLLLTSGAVMLSFLALPPIASQAAHADAFGDAMMAYMADDYVKAYPLLEQAVLQGDGNAAYYLGLMYRSGRGVPKSDTQAFNWFKKGAELGDAEAQISLGGAYYEGKGTTQSYKLAADWYEKAALSGDVGGMMFMGRAFEEGKGRTQNYEKASNWYKKADQNGASFAKLRLEKLRAKTVVQKKTPEPYKGVDQSRFAAEGREKSVLKCAELYSKRKYDKAYKKCLKPAKNGNAVAQNNLGFIQKKRSSMGRKINSNTTRYGLKDGEDNSETWFLRAANQGYAVAQYDWSRNGGAFQWKIKAAENGHSIAQMALGEFYENTDLGDPNYKMAVYWYEKAAAQGVPYAQKRLQIIYGGGYAKKSDAAEVAERMSSNGTVDAFIGAIQINSNWVEPGDEQSEILYVKGMKIYDEGFNYVMGRATKKVDMQSALPIFSQAAKRGNAKATYMEGAMQPISERDADRDLGRLEQARLYALSAEMGYKKAQYQLAELYNSGETIAKSYPQAAYWYKKAAAQGHAEAKERLRYLLQQGRVSINEIPQSADTVQHKFSPKENYFAGLEAGYKQQHKKAETLLLRSAREGHKGAQAALGKMYYSGEGVQRSLENAYKWYKAAGLQGDTQSQYMMGYMWQHNEARAGATNEGLFGKFYPDPIETARWWYEKASVYDDKAKQQLQAISGYSPPPPPPAPKRGWFEQMAADAYNRSMQPKVYNTPISPKQEICGAWRCYNVGSGKEQCFRDCG